jgi:hypothetical protein
MVNQMGSCHSYIKIQVIRSQSVECLLKAFLRIGMMGVPQLASDKDFPTWYTAISDAVSNFVFVPVDSSLR